jgi:hypothetical protein
MSTQNALLLVFLVMACSLMLVTGQLSSSSPTATGAHSLGSTSSSSVAPSSTPLGGGAVSSSSSGSDGAGHSSSTTSAAVILSSCTGASPSTPIITNSVSPSPSTAPTSATSPFARLTSLVASSSSSTAAASLSMSSPAAVPPPTYPETDDGIGGGGGGDNFSLFGGVGGSVLSIVFLIGICWCYVKYCHTPSCRYCGGDPVTDFCPSCGTPRRVVEMQPVREGNLRPGGIEPWQQY